MAQSLPVIVSSAKPLKRIVEETDCGYIFEAENAKSLTNTIIYILNNKNELLIKGTNGYHSIKNKYNWEEDQKILFQIIQKILN